MFAYISKAVKYNGYNSHEDFSFIKKLARLRLYCRFLQAGSIHKLVARRNQRMKKSPLLGGKRWGMRLFVPR